MKTRTESARGYSLLEVLFAVFLLTVVFVGLTGYMRVQRKALGVSDQQSEAARIAVTSLDGLKTQLSDTARFNKLAKDLEKKAGHRDSSRTTQAAANRAYEVDVVKESLGVPGLIRIRVRTTWNQRKHSFTLSKLLAP